jgi:hypothetical protein
MYYVFSMSLTGLFGAFEGQNMTAGVMGVPFADVTVSGKVCADGADRAREQVFGMGRRCVREHAIGRPG